MHRKNTAPSGRNIDWCLWGNSIHSMIASDRLRTGARRKGVLFALIGLFCSFRNSLIASANGTGKPISMGLFGPFRSWKYPRNFRSIRVKNAIATSASTYERIVEVSGMIIIKGCQHHNQGLNLMHYSATLIKI